MKISKAVYSLIAGLIALPLAGLAANSAPAVITSNIQPATETTSDRVEGHPYLVPAAVSIFAPAGFGADQDTIFATAGVVNQWPGTDKADGYMVTGFGFGNGEKTLGVTASFLIDSLGINHSFAHNGASAIQVFKWLTPNMSVSAGAANMIGWGAYANASDSIYFSATQLMKLIQTAHWDMPLALTVGAGSGAFNSPHDFVIGNDSHLLPFASAAFGIFNRTNLIVDYTTHFLTTGISIMPFRNIPLGLTGYATNLAPETSHSPQSVSFGFRVSAGYRFA